MSRKRLEHQHNCTPSLLPPSMHPVPHPFINFAPSILASHPAFHTSTHPCIHASIYPSIPSVRPSVNPSISPSLHLPVCIQPLPIQHLMYSSVHVIRGTSRLSSVRPRTNPHGTYTRSANLRCAAIGPCSQEYVVYSRKANQSFEHLILAWWVFYLTSVICLYLFYVFLCSISVLKICLYWSLYVYSFVFQIVFLFLVFVCLDLSLCVFMCLYMSLYALLFI